MSLTFCSDLRESPVRRRSFFQEAQRTFGLSFQPWFQAGYWGDRYLPQAFLDGDQVVANLSLNRMDTVRHGRSRQYLQLGTFFVRPDHRGQGLGRLLLERVLAEWTDQCDAIYLFANRTVRTLYPKFGFVQTPEYEFVCPVHSKPSRLRRLDLSVPADLELLHTCYRRSNPYAQLPMQNNFDLLMFYCLGELGRCVWYLEDFHLVAIADPTASPLICYDLYGERRVPLQTVLSALAPAGVAEAKLGFSPLEPFGTLTALEGDDTLFFYSGKENPFWEQPLMFPLLSHA